MNQPRGAGGELGPQEWALVVSVQPCGYIVFHPRGFLPFFSFSKESYDLKKTSRRTIRERPTVEIFPFNRQAFGAPGWVSQWSMQLLISGL